VVRRAAEVVVREPESLVTVTRTETWKPLPSSVDPVPKPAYADGVAATAAASAKVVIDIARNIRCLPGAAVD
jgi:hypothetical protein